jgi:RNA polymerase sigma factor (sigma-70 family)
MSSGVTTNSAACALVRPPLERTAVRDEAQFRAMYDANFRAVLGYALRRVSAAQDAGDVVADTFLVAWRRRDDVPDDPGEARAWLFATARRVLANHRRGEERRGRLAERLRAEIAAMPLAADAPDDVLAVHVALRGLSDDDRELLTLTSWEEMTPGDISIALGVPAATVRTRLHRARRRLARLLADLWRQDMERSAVAGHVQSEPDWKGAGRDA